MNRRAVSQTLLLALVFFGPVLLAVLAFYGSWDWLPRGAAARGELIEPPTPLPRGTLAMLAIDEGPAARSRSRWLLIYAHDGRCGESCAEQVQRLNQVRLALAEDRERVQLVLLTAAAEPRPRVEAEFSMAVLDGDMSRPTSRRLAHPEIRAGRVYIADPLGNLVMRYPPSATQKDMLDDLKRFLTLVAWPAPR